MEIPTDKLEQAAKFLDEKPKALSSAACKDEYWRQLINALPQRRYTRAQIEEFAEQLLTPKGSPARELLLDLRKKRLKYEAFLDCLEKIKCYKALSLFIQFTVPEITLHPEDQIVHVGDTLVLRCCAKCIPSPPDYHWHCNGVPMRNMRDPVLRIDDVHTYIDGTYTCKVTNKYINDPNNNFVWTRPAKVHVEIVNPSTPETCEDDNVVSSRHSSITSTDSTFKSLLSRSHDHQLPVDADHVIGSSELGLTTPDSSTLDSHKSDGPLSMSDDQQIDTEANAGEDGDIVIQKHPSSLSCHYNKPFKLECHAQSKQGKTLKFTWMMKRRGQSSVTEVYTEYSKTSSTLSHTWPKHETIVIYCEITHKDGDSSEKVTSNKAKVSVKTVWIVEQPKSVRKYIGESATLYCKAEGEGPIEYMWLKTLEDDKKERVSEFSSNGTLNFDVLESRIWGSYTCQAQNKDDFVASNTVSVRFRAKNDAETCADDTMGSSQLGSTTPNTSSNTELTYLYTSVQSDTGTCGQVSRSDDRGDIVIQKHPSNLTCHYNEPFKLECHAQSKLGKTLKFTWMMKRRGRSSVTELYAEYSEASSTLSCTWPKHETIMIYCEITHKDGDSSEKVTSDIAKVSVNTLWIVEQPKSVYNKYIGESATLYCKAEGKGPIEYMWLKTLEDDKKERVSEFSSNGTLNFNVLESGIWGSYTCQAQNKDDFVASNTVSVRFRAKNDANTCADDDLLSRGSDCQTDTRANAGQGVVDYCSIFNEHFARLVDAVSNPVMLGNHLSSADLIPSRIAMNILSITGEGVYEHSTRLFNEVRRLLQTVQGSEEQQKTTMQRFCGVLHKQDSPSLRILADQILKETGLSSMKKSESNL